MDNFFVAWLSTISFSFIALLLGVDVVFVFFSASLTVVIMAIVLVSSSKRNKLAIIRRKDDGN